MFNTAFNSFLPTEQANLDYYPESLRDEIDQINTWIYDTVNNGVYKSGFASTQEAYEKNVVPLFESLDRIEKILDGHKYLVQDTFTEADIRLFTTIVSNYPNILEWTRRIYQKTGVKETVNMDHIKRHYYESHANINPTRVVPLGTGPDLSVPVEP
ncbi:hypothetical protein G6F56_002428 [Rhizopus delemar]|nr:hypothetical protein G6F56_002428 [Rhizopus delemar]